MWLAGNRLDMRDLARLLGVSRTTIYKWCGDRDQLVVDVIWSFTQRSVDQAWAATEHLQGRLRAQQALRLFVESVTQSSPLHAFLRNETHAALRLLTTRGPFQARLVDAVADHLREEDQRAPLHLRADAEVIAFAIVRTIEAFVYNDAIGTVEPEIDSAMQIVGLILG